VRGRKVNYQGKEIKVISIGQNSNEIELDDLFNPEHQCLEDWIDQIRSMSSYKQINLLNYYFLNLEYLEDNVLIQRMKSPQFKFAEFISKYFFDKSAIFKALELPRNKMIKEDDLYLEYSEFLQFEKDVDNFIEIINP
jgi:hypothetical protein